MNVEDDSWFFGDEHLRVLTGRLLGQFQHRVAQYNYIDEREVLRRWADGYDTRLFIRRRIYETEPVVGVVERFDLRQVQYLRLIAGGNTLVPSEDAARALEALGYEAGATTTRSWPVPRSSRCTSSFRLWWGRCSKISVARATRTSPSRHAKRPARRAGGRRARDGERGS